MATKCLWVYIRYPSIYTHTPVIYMSKLSFNYNLIYAAQPKSATKTQAQSTPYETTTSLGHSKTISKNDTVRALDEQKINNLL